MQAGIVRGHMRNPNVLLVSMPWASNNRPSLAVGVLSSLAKHHGYGCCALYPTFDFASEIGIQAYESVAENASLFGLSEHLFATHVFGKVVLQSDEFLTAYSANAVKPFKRLRDEIVPEFVRGTAKQIIERAPNIVGFTCTFNQVFASLAAAKELKQLAPNIEILIGGACVHGDMGVSFARAFPNWLNHVFTGEADKSFPEFLDRWARHDETPVAGVTYGGSLRTGPTIAEQCFADECIPDFDDWFHQRRAHSQFTCNEATSQDLAIPFESSRGCWWGQKNHCTFCGLNNEGMTYRRKGVKRIVEEVTTQSRRYGCISFMAADNILDYRAFSEFLPALTALNLDLRFFYEVKANLDRDKIAAMATAGVRWIQPGIESFSSHVLSLMRKGTTSLQNLQMLRLAAEYTITVSYNILVGFPGEEHTDYHEMISLMSKVLHLPPPSGAATPVQVHRFSPFFDDPRRHGVANVRACTYYAHLLPADVGRPEAFAYFFERDIPTDAPMHEWLGKLNATIAVWREGYGLSRKTARLGPGFVEIGVLVDGKEKRVTLDPVQSAVFVLADNVTTPTMIQNQLSGGSSLVGQGIHDEIAKLIDMGILVRDHQHIVSVVPYEQPRTIAQLNAWLTSYGPSRESRSETPNRQAVKSLVD